MIFTAIYCICEKHIIYIFFEFTIKLCLLGYASRILQGLVNPRRVGAKVKKHAHTGSTLSSRITHINTKKQFCSCSTDCTELYTSLSVRVHIFVSSWKLLFLKPYGIKKLFICSNHEVTFCVKSFVYILSK